MLVVDSSIVVAALVTTLADGDWAISQLAAHSLVAPHLLPVEAANTLRQLERSGTITSDVATLAHADLRVMQVDLLPYEPFGQRIWELRHNLTAYDAWYVALAEGFDIPLATLDIRLPNAPGTACEFLLPGDSQ